MRRERVADDIYVFTSDLYAQVTAGAVVTAAGAILIDTLVFPEEAKAIRQFIEQRLNTHVRYVINTHYHADHTYGNCFFPEAIIVSSALCYEYLKTRGQSGLDQAQKQSKALQEVILRLPTLVFESGGMEIRLGEKTLELRPSPGHSDDSITVHVREDRVMFAADTMMPIPYFVDGRYDDLVQSIEKLRGGGYENVIQGHGDIVLRGEIERKVEEDLDYLRCIREHVERAINQANPQAYLDTVDIESCGKSRIPLNGEVQKLHEGNLKTLLGHYQAMQKA